MKQHDPLVPPRQRLGQEEVYAAALRGERCYVLGLAPGAVAMPVDRWCNRADDSDHRMLDHCEGSTIDIGCGPGRMTIALARRGNRVLGIDKVPEAVHLARSRGASAVLRDVFEDTMDEGTWDTALLADGNIGIGGDPLRLLRRGRQLVHGRGSVVVDLAPPGTGLVTRTLRLQVGEMLSEPFEWTEISVEALHDLAGRAGYHVVSVVRHRSRWLAELRVSPGQ